MRQATAAKIEAIHVRMSTDPTALFGLWIRLWKIV
jgi:hypothetical protein